MKRLLFVFGTRPEAIKMAPVIHEALKHKDRLQVGVCLTGQHKEMLGQVMNFFLLKEDMNISLMKPNQTLFSITADALTHLQHIYTEWKPDLVLVQGDTTTAFVGALGAYYLKIKVAHIEAGLRSHDKYAPFPEEMNRKMIGSMADFHFAPTEKAADNLRNEQVEGKVYVTGNTVIDALLWAVEKTKSDQSYNDYFHYIDTSKRTILVTGHRRESFGKPFENICNALNDIAERFNDVQIVYPVHLNPNVQQIVREKLSNTSNIHLVEPLDYPKLIWLMNNSYIVITDSGGIQEEAPSLGKPVLVMRDVTERMEGVQSGNALLVGTNTERIVEEATKLLTNDQHYRQMSEAANPYGDGKSAERIIQSLLTEL